MNLKTTLVVALSLMLVLGTMFAVTADVDVGTVEIDGVEDLIAPAPAGCGDYCAYCTPINGDGACTSAGSCC